MCPDVAEVRHVLELLERRARRDPQRQIALGHRLERVGTAEPALVDDLLARDGGHGPEGQLRGEEPGVEAAGQHRRRRPREIGTSQSVPERQVELGGEGLEPDLARDQGGAGGTGTPGAAAGRRPAGHAGLLEDLADRRHERGDRAVGSGRRPGPRPPPPPADRARDKARMRVGRVDATAGEDMNVRGEGHRGRSAPQEDLGSRAPGPQQDDRRGGPGLGRERRPVVASAAILVAVRTPCGVTRRTRIVLPLVRVRPEPYVPHPWKRTAVWS